VKESRRSGRNNQKLRTRAALLAAAAALIGSGRKPTVADAAEEALVSRATAYRYFPSQDELLNEAVLHASMGIADEHLKDSFSRVADPEDRVDEAERGIHNVVCDHEFQMRLLLRASLDKWFAGGGARTGIPHRQARRREWFEAALAPVRDELGKKIYETLSCALSMLTGVESLIVLDDILKLDRRQARRVKSWAVRALVREALRQSSAGSRARRGKPR
jgi:AcrR family transcriptional regulator